MISQHPISSGGLEVIPAVQTLDLLMLETQWIDDNDTESFT